jgi:uncharacterized membrane protein YphA (DoxX/SURF4 family)
MQEGLSRRLAPVVLRVGLAALFLWFGISQLVTPQEWVSWVPAWAPQILHGDARAVVLFNGGFETIGGTLLLLGIVVRWVVLFLGLHLLLIAYEIGYDAIAIRDLCIAVSCFALSLFGSDEWSLDRIL